MNEFDQLVLSAQQGSSVAMNAVIKYMYKVIFAKLYQTWIERPGGHSTEDMAQFAMVEVCDAIKTYDGKRCARNWLLMHARSAILTETRYLYANKRRANIFSKSLDKPLNVGKNEDEEITLASILPGIEDTESEAIGNLSHDNLIDHLAKELSEVEFAVMDCMLKDYPTREITNITGYRAKTVDNAKERIKVKIKKYLAVG